MGVHGARLCDFALTIVAPFSTFVFVVGTWNVSDDEPEGGPVPTLCAKTFAALLKIYVFCIHVNVLPRHW